MRERFEQQMEILHTELIELGALCEQAIGRTYEVLLEGNQRAAEEIIKKDQVVDAKEREIEDLCFRIILQQQPVARDLRQVSAALKMITDMERIGYCGYRKSNESWCAGCKHPSEGYGESNSFYGNKMHRCIR